MNELTSEQRGWVERTMAGLSLRERIGQMILPMLTKDTAAPLSIGEYVARTGIGGGHLFGGPAARCRALAEEAQRAANVPLLVSGDFEVGAGERIPEGTHLPGRMAIGAAGDERLSYEAGRAIALEAAACGYNLAYGPIVDLAVVRDYQRQVDAFGRDPASVARMGAAAVRGLQENGMAACAKHFPGDGFDDRDQHLMTLVNPLSAQDWWAQSAAPFRAAIEAGVHSIMVSCIGLPSLDPETEDPRVPTPALVSRPLIEDLLRKRMGFDGVVISDALNMGGVSYRLRELDRYEAAIRAGVDLLIFVRHVPRVLEELEASVERGTLPRARVDESCRRVLELKARLNLHVERMPDEAAGRARFAASPGPAVAREIAERSVTLIRDRHGLMPLRRAKDARVAVILVTNQPPERFGLQVFEDTLRAGGVEVTAIRDPATDAVHDRIAAGEFDAVVTALYFPVQYAWNTQRIHGPYSRCLMSGFPIAHPDAKPVWISFGNPNHLYELPFMDPYLVTYGGSPASQRAAAQALLGEIPIAGRIPMELPGFFELGAGLRRAGPERTGAA